MTNFKYLGLLSPSDCPITPSPLHPFCSTSFAIPIFKTKLRETITIMFSMTPWWHSITYNSNEKCIDEPILPEPGLNHNTECPQSASKYPPKYPLEKKQHSRRNKGSKVHMGTVDELGAFHGPSPDDPTHPHESCEDGDDSIAPGDSLGSGSAIPWLHGELEVTHHIDLLSKMGTTLPWSQSSAHICWKREERWGVLGGVVGGYDPGDVSNNIKRQWQDNSNTSMQSIFHNYRTTFINWNRPNRGTKAHATCLYIPFLSHATDRGIREW